MTCHEFWNEMPELAGEPEVPDHARECPSCAALLERQRSLAAGLSRMAKDLKSREAPQAVEERLLGAFRAQTGLPPRTARRYWPAWVAAAAVIVLSISLTLGRHGQPAGPALSAPALAELGQLDPDFIPLPYGTADLADSTGTDDPDLVRVEVPRSALVALGLPVDENGSGRVEAVVALGSDGLLEGIRIVQ